MQLINKPDRGTWKEILQRPYVNDEKLVNQVRVILNEVKDRGDDAIRDYTKKFDQVDITDLVVSVEEIEKAGLQISPELKMAIEQAMINIEKFHRAQLVKESIVETMPGIHCWRKSLAIERVGFYIPGGTAPLFSTVLMLGIPALIAGCKEIILCTPCNKNGEINPAILYSAQRVGIKKIYKAGGAQAIAAMAHGTETIPAVCKIFGPGNQYVTTAKQLVQMHGVSIDIPAGPSEVCILADDSADPAFIAADLLSQAEHGIDSQVLLVCYDQGVIDSVETEIEKQLLRLPRKEIADKVLKNSKAIIVAGIDDAIDLCNEYAAEHLIICCADAGSVADKITNAGSVFIGNYSPESVGDYASGTNHTLPTNGFAKAHSGVSVDSFVKKITYQKLSKQGLNAISETVIHMAEAEGLQAHANAVRVRIHN